MYNFGRVTREIGPEWYRDSSEMGMGLGGIGAFLTNFITQVRGNSVRKSGQKSTGSFATLSLPEFATDFQPITSPTSALGERDDRYFRLAAKAKRQGDGTDAPVDIELHSIPQAEEPVHVLDSHIR
jgi:hypothetical protein